MNRTLVTCLCLSIAAGSFCAGLALHAGLGWFAALGVYSLTGSLSLVTLAALSVALETTGASRPRPAPAMDAYACQRT